MQVDEHTAVLGLEKKAKQFDRLVGELKTKADNLAMDLDIFQNETRIIALELLKIKHSHYESLLQLEQVHKENKNFSTEIKDIMA